MTIQVIRLGTERGDDEGVRLGTVRRLPRGVKKSNYTVNHWFDVWLPILSPSSELMKQGHNSKSEGEWSVIQKNSAWKCHPPMPTGLLNY